MINKTKRSQKWIKKIKEHKHTGTHLIAEFWYGKIIEDPKKFKAILEKSVKVAKSTPLETIIHKFSPQGITGVVLLAESHLAIHTWPELNYTAIDVFTCGSHTKPKKALAYLKKEFAPKKVEVKEFKRGAPKK